MWCSIDGTTVEAGNPAQLVLLGGWTSMADFERKSAIHLYRRVS